ncbi:TraY domain-containing protein [Rahnella sp. BCC 1045]|uniref:TraY domain-containing protein n=1 Tax=Rahnella sp. BCC 1045 TaxID=2816251 RepID=UPI001C261F0D|nr:TraY domain-containing protein [Rahnella sp. BCC 1045]MBU9819687.1 TraY domain-containing protein [Rahnella sp. BCC 1045]
MPANNKDKPKVVLLQLTPELIALLTAASGRSGRSKTREAYVRLEDHLKLYTDFAAFGRRFPAEGSDTQKS